MEGIDAEVKMGEILESIPDKKASSGGGTRSLPEDVTRKQSHQGKIPLAILPGIGILRLRKFFDGRPSVMGFVVCAINTKLVMVSGTRKGREAFKEPSQRHGLFVYGGGKMEGKTEFGKENVVVDRIGMNEQIGAVKALLGLLVLCWGDAGGESLKDEIIYLFQDAEEKLGRVIAALDAAEVQR